MGLFVNPEPKLTLEQHNEPLLTITEAYFGDDILKKAQMHLSNYRKDVMEKSSFLKYSHPELIAFDREIEKIFGFYIFDLNIVESNMTNACTLPISWKIGYNLRNPNKCTFNKKTGYKYDPELKYCCSMELYTGIFTNPEYTDREVMAVILHEIGHNFQEIALDYEGKFGLNAIKKNMGVLMYFKVIIDAIIDSITNANPMIAVNTVKSLVTSAFETSMWFERLDANATRWFARTFPAAFRVLDIFNTGAGKLGGFFTDVIGSAMYLFNTFLLYNPLTLLFNVGLTLLGGLNPVNIATLGIAYNEERFADNFATMYGYGPETASVQKKFGTHGFSNSAEKVLNHSPMIGSFANLVWAPLNVASQMFDEHPSTMVRIEDQAELLRKELERNSNNPRMKQQIKKEMLEVEAIAREFDQCYRNTVGANNISKFEDPKVYTHILQEVLFKLSGNKDFAAKFASGDLHEMIDKKFK